MNIFVDLVTNPLPLPTYDALSIHERSTGFLFALLLHALFERPLGTSLLANPTVCAEGSNNRHAKCQKDIGLAWDSAY